jgi:hypothetical protein
MDNITPASQSSRIVGTWKHCDGFSDIEFSFSVVNGSVAVSVVDTSDDETPEIFDVTWDDNQLTLFFAAHWRTGRFVKYRVAVGPNANRMEATITYTVQELWERQ